MPPCPDSHPGLLPFFRQTSMGPPSAEARPCAWTVSSRTTFENAPLTDVPGMTTPSTLKPSAVMRAWYPGALLEVLARSTSSTIDVPSHCVTVNVASADRNGSAPALMLPVLPFRPTVNESPTANITGAPMAGTVQTRTIGTTRDSVLGRCMHGSWAGRTRPPRLDACQAIGRHATGLNADDGPDGLQMRKAPDER